MTALTWRHMATAFAAFDALCSKLGTDRLSTYELGLLVASLDAEQKVGLRLAYRFGLLTEHRHDGGSVTYGRPVVKPSAPVPPRSTALPTKSRGVARTDRRVRAWIQEESEYHGFRLVSAREFGTPLHVAIHSFGRDTGKRITLTTATIERVLYRAALLGRREYARYAG